MPDTPAPDSNTLPQSTADLRSRSAVRPGTPPADSPALAATRAERVAVTTPGGGEPSGLTADSVMPTCMIYAMFAGLALLVGTMLCWMGNAVNTALHLFH